MLNTRVRLDPESPDRPLRVLLTGLMSDASVIPENVPEGMQPVFTFVQPGETVPQMIYGHHPVDAPTQWKIIIGGWNFTTEGTVEYQFHLVSEADPETNPQGFCGAGQLVIRRTHINAVVPPPGPVQVIKTLEAEDGTSYRVFIETNEFGVPSVSLEQQPVPQEGE